MLWKFLLESQALAYSGNSQQLCRCQNVIPGGIRGYYRFMQSLSVNATPYNRNSKALNLLESLDLALAFV